MQYKGVTIHYHLMLLPGMIILFIYNLLPISGNIMAFQDYIPAKGISGSEWIGFENFTYMFELESSRRVFFNTIFIASMKIIMNIIVPVTFALLLNEVIFMKIKRSIQTIVYLPHFLSWVVLAGVLIDMLSGNGLINKVISFFTGETMFFLASNTWFPVVIVLSDVWKEFGFNAIIILAALTAINPALYEAADIDGASRLRKIWHITLPGIAPTIVLLSTLSIGQILNAGFDQIFNLYNPLVYESGDIIDTYVYRTGLINAQFGLATAVGMMKAVIGFVLIILSYRLAYRYANYRIF
ncbi:ABC transporter permease subunit [Gracilibacillus salitolerans]|uniref:ABC transporter permease subunit n=1 Tax=Gracilibacillus salitolerans TaxID=2663022 RepID=A0A5Q2TPQ3_9BACI|nr:ABC transporter permease subunit [Gracilibacillus salitolerans]QGH36077.1 ABC transporter permease subunit [Gracilibacillus salitolerans]